VHISYGPKCDAEFLSNYGFRPWNNTHVPCHDLEVPPSRPFTPPRF
jgi:hypothetical protein